MGRTFVALLRGINVGGRNPIRMADLRACLVDAGFADVRTYIQSGNVVFRSDEPDRERLRHGLEQTLARTFDYDATVELRDRAELQAVIEQAPAGFGSDLGTYRCEVIFLLPPLTRGRGARGADPQGWGRRCLARARGRVHHARGRTRLQERHLEDRLAPGLQAHDHPQLDHHHQAARDDGARLSAAVRRLRRAVEDDRLRAGHHTLGGTRLNPRSALVSLIAAVALAAPATAVVAEDATYPVRLYDGTCDAPGEVVASLTEVTPGASATAEPTAMEAVEQALGSAVTAEHATVPMALADIVSGDLVIGVDDGAGGSAEPAICGQFGGFELGAPDLQAGLVARDGSGAHGVAWLHDNGDGTTAVSILVAPAIEPGTAAAEGDEVQVAISKSQYLPSPLEVAVGTTVTWTDEDLLPHTVTATKGGFDSGYLAQGDRYSHTFDTPGEFGYFCVYHPRMRATVVVN